MTPKGLLQLLHFFSFISSALLVCPPLIHRAGIRVTCTTPSSSTAEGAAAFDCDDRSQNSANVSPILSGTVATYDCMRPFYVPLTIDAAGGGGLKRQRRLTCTESGRWSGGIARFRVFSCALSCGVNRASIAGAGSITGFIQGGSVTDQSEWPWHAAIFARKRSTAKFEYICGGSLIKPTAHGEFLILTAAHCMEQARATRQVDDVRIVLGADESKLEDVHVNSPDAQVLRVREIFVHGDYDGIAGAFRSDIALLRLEDPVQLTLHVLPVCLSRHVAMPVIGGIGHLAGFGRYVKDDRSISLELRRASFPVVDSEKCVWTDNEDKQRRKLNSQELCAGTDGGPNACNGDSGGGFVFNATDAAGVTRFYLHGIVSNGKLEGDKLPTCDTYTVFTRVNSYLDWIARMVDSFEETDTTQETRPTPSPRTMPTQTTAPTTTVQTPQSTQIMPATSTSGWRPECGRTDSRIYSPTTNAGGTELVTRLGDWPWHAAIFKRSKPGGSGTDDRWEYTCDGSLVEGDVVITSATCMTNFRTQHRGETPTQMHPYDLLVVFWLMQKPDTSVTREWLVSAGTQFFEVLGVARHPGYKQRWGTTNDTAVLLTAPHSDERGGTAYLDSMTALCLPKTPSSQTIENANGGDDTVAQLVGFGSYTDEDPNKLRRVRIPIVDPVKCEGIGLSGVDVDQFCAGDARAKSACYGNSGGAVVQSKIDKSGSGHRLYLHGVALARKTPCEFGVYTRVEPYMDWIRETKKCLTHQNPDMTCR